MGLGYTLDHAATLVPVKGDQRDLILRYGEQPVQHAQAAWACLLDATAGAAFEERVLSAVTVRDAWCQILSWTGPSSEAETFFLERQLETVPNYGDENPKLFFSRVDQLLTRLRSADIHKTERQIVNILVRNLSDHYEIEKRSRLDSPLLRRQDVEHIVRASWATRKTRQLEQRSTSGVTPNPHALVARGGYGGPRRGGGRSSGSGRGLQQSWSRGGGNHHIHRQQQYGSGSRSYRAKPFVRHYRGGDGTALWPQQQHGPRPFCSFGWEQRGACRDGPPVNGLAHSIAQGQAQRDVEMDCHGGPVSKVSGPPERGGPPLQARHQRGLQPPSETLSPPAAVISDSASEE